MKKGLLAILGGALAVRVILMVVMNTYAHPVTWEYENMVNNILSGKGFVLDNYYGTPYRCVQPLYVFLNAGIYAVTNHSYAAVLLAQSLFSLCLVYVIFRIAQMLFGERVALLSAFLVAFHPGFVYYDVVNLMPLSLDSLCIATAAWLFMRCKDSPSVRGVALSGSIIGLGALTRGIIGALLPFLSAYFLIFTRHSLMRKMAFIFVLWAAAFVVLAPWTLRNYMLKKEFVLISSSSGEALYRGNNPAALGTSLTPGGRSVSVLWPKEVTDRIAALDEVGQKKFFESEAIRFIKNDPMAFAKLYVKKFRYFWWFSHQSGALYPKAYLAIYKILYLPFLVFTLCGILCALVCGNRAVKDNAWLIVFVCMSISFTQSLFYVEGRHRWLVEPMLMIFFSSGIMKACEYGIGKIRSLKRGIYAHT